jgi:hypothetical protein
MMSADACPRFFRARFMASGIIRFDVDKIDNLDSIKMAQS